MIQITFTISVEIDRDEMPSQLIINHALQEMEEICARQSWSLYDSSIEKEDV